MLRIVAHKSAAAARSYYAEGLRREDYYSEKQEVIGKWFGKAAPVLGLAGNVTPEAFAALTENRHPETGEALTPRTKTDRRVGYDLNFHAPKSLSILHALTGDDRIVTAFRSAVAETMAEIETQAATRVRRAGAQKERLTENLVWAEFVHFTSRPVGGVPDPHLHVHAFAFNATHDGSEGRWKAVSWAGIKKDGPYSEAAFHARLAENVARLGYGIERKIGGWEVAGVSRALVEKFSRRTAQIEELAKTRGISDPRALDELGAISREGKRHGLTQKQLVELWEGRLTPSENAWLSVLRGNRPRPLEEVMTPERAFEEAEAKVFAKNSAIEVKRLVGEALRYGVGQISPERAWAEFEKRRMVVRELGGETICTSLDALAEEVALINFAREGRSRSAALCPGKLAFVNHKLSDEQRLAARRMLKSRDQIIALRGVAGAGKTTLMEEVVPQIEATGLRVFAFAPSAGASRGTLRESGFVNAQTLAHLIHNPKLQSETRGQVIWVDEAGTIGVEDMVKLMKIAGTKTRIILSGDTAQHAPVARGDAFRIMQKYAGLPVAELTEIRRQEAESYRKAVAAISKGDLRTGFRLLDEMGAIHEIENDAMRYRSLAQDFVGLSRGALMPLAVSPTHSEIARVTEAIRAARREAGQLGTDKTFTQFVDLKWEEPDRRVAGNYREGLAIQLNQNVKGFKRGAILRVVGQSEGDILRVCDAAGVEKRLPAKFGADFSVYEERQIALAQGDRIRITRNGKSVDGRRLDNGDLAVISKLTRGGKIILESGAELEARHGHFAYGYCQTSHVSQSKTSGDVLVAQASESVFVSSREQFYVSVSRGRKTLRIYTDDVLQLQKAVGNSSQRRSAVEFAGLTKKEIAGLMSDELDFEKWRKHVASTRGTEKTKDAIEKILNERRPDPKTGKQWTAHLASRRDGDKTHVETLDKERRVWPEKADEKTKFQKFIEYQRKRMGPDGKSRSKGLPSPTDAKKQGIDAKGRSNLRPTEMTEKTKAKFEANKQKKAEKPRMKRSAKAFEAAKRHFKKVATRTKTAVNSFKKGVRSKLFPGKTGANDKKKENAKAERASKAKKHSKGKEKMPPPRQPVKTRK